MYLEIIVLHSSDVNHIYRLSRTYSVKNTAALATLGDLLLGALVPTTVHTAL